MGTLNEPSIVHHDGVYRWGAEIQQRWASITWAHLALESRLHHEESSSDNMSRVESACRWKARDWWRSWISGNSEWEKGLDGRGVYKLRIIVSSWKTKYFIIIRCTSSLIMHFILEASWRLTKLTFRIYLTFSSSIFSLILAFPCPYVSDVSLANRVLLELQKLKVIVSVF